MALNENEYQALVVMTDRLQLNPELVEYRGEDLFEKLSAYINDLVNNNFNLLVSMLYRMDVSESKLRNTLASYSDKSAGDLIAGLMIERELEKIKWRENYSQK